MRHGMTDWNHDGRIQGGLDRSRLNNTGVRQARRAGESLRNVAIDAVICSPLGRARHTFRLLAEASANPCLLSRKPEVLQALMEIQVPWQGSLRKEICRGPFSALYAKYKRNPARFSYNGYYPIRDLTRRAQLVWDTVKRTSGSSVLLIGHNQINKALICEGLGIPTNLASWNQSNCCFSVFDVENHKPPILRTCNCIDLESSTFKKRARQRPGYVRLYMHHKGDIEGLRLEMGTASIAHIYCIGDVSCDEYRSLRNMPNVCSKRQLQTVDAGESMFANCVTFLQHIRSKHINEAVVICFDDPTVHTSLFSACIGLGARGTSTLRSDPGGLTVIDVSSTVPIGTGSPRIECYNAYAYASAGPLFGYTITQADVGKMV